jgi:acyl carrier protein
MRAGPAHIRLATLLLAAAALLPVPGAALPPVPYFEIEATVRELAARQVDRPVNDIDTASSLAAQGFSENDLHELVVALNDEFGVVISSDEVRQAKWNDPMPAVSVRYLARLVERHMQRRE